MEPLPISLTQLVGRDQELTAPVTLLHGADVRLLTLTDHGGVGETRLTIAAATQVIDDFPDGVAFVGLAPIADAGLINTNDRSGPGLGKMDVSLSAPTVGRGARPLSPGPAASQPSSCASPGLCAPSR